MNKPNFDNLLKVLNRQQPDRPTLFEFFLNDPLYKKLAGEEVANMTDAMADYRTRIAAFTNAGYDYVTLYGSGFHFPRPQVQHLKTRSLNENAVITDMESFQNYPWPDPAGFDYSILDKVQEMLPEGMKVIVYGPGGVLENVIDLVGYDNLCYMTVDNPDLAQQIFDAVGLRLVTYYEICAPYESVGALISNDDWGFKTQTMLSPKDMRRYVIPWHKKIVEAIHKAGKPAILHSCGNLELLMDDIIDDIGYDAKHSFEDSILPVEEAYELYGKRIAILGGIDLDFVCRAAPEEVRRRSASMLERAQGRGGYALGTGNSVPDYVPHENYFAMISAALDTRGGISRQGGSDW
jgi:uroporphyrinogen decarboxylase